MAHRKNSRLIIQWSYNYCIIHSDISIFVANYYRGFHYGFCSSALFIWLFGSSNLKDIIENDMGDQAPCYQGHNTNHATTDKERHAGSTGCAWEYFHSAPNSRDIVFCFSHVLSGSATTWPCSCPDDPWKSVRVWICVAKAWLLANGATGVIGTLGSEQEEEVEPLRVFPWRRNLLLFSVSWLLQAVFLSHGLLQWDTAFKPTGSSHNRSKP